MLGRLRRTTGLDVGLALGFSGVSYLVWALVAGNSRELVQQMIWSADLRQTAVPAFTQNVKIFFVDAGFVIDLAGVAWMILSMALILFASRQKISISWSWVSAICQAFGAALGGVLVAWAVYMPHVVPTRADEPARTGFERVSAISLPLLVPVAVLLWVTCLIWLLVERARLSRHGPTLTDGLRTNIFR